ncbi:CENP-S associating centromere protein X-domain-containing protein [Xylariaceae sp. AK1471]|nr:CENP-S associating centromere protein X-domain-containing protein [Xylariaceae sp. AK1471]
MSSKHLSGTSRGRPRGGSTAVQGPSKTGATSTNKAQKTTSSRSRNQPSQSPQMIPSDKSDADPFADDDLPQRRRKDGMDTGREESREEGIEEDDEDAETKKTIPPDLLTRILHEFFEKDGTRVSKDANKAVAKYMDIFVREAIARTAVEKGVGFLEVEDLEKVAPQLLMDL